MYFQQISTPGLGCFSYAIGCPLAGVMAVVDPRRDIGVYLAIAENNDMRITHIFDTHVHADHISGAQQLRASTNADIYIHESVPVSYGAKYIKHNDEFKFGNAVVRILHTPGHTPNSISLLVSDLSRSSEPEMVLTGDTLFVGDVGRPDLPGDEILDEQIKNLYISLYKTLGQLPDYLEVYPGHGQGSLCGQGMSAKPSSTLGYERLTNPTLKHADFDSFKKTMLSSKPMRPQSFSGIIAANMGNINILPYNDNSKYSLSADETDELCKNGAQLLDLRDDLSFSAAHIPGSFHVDASASNMLNWIGAVIPFGKPLVLVLPNDKNFDEIYLELQRIGYDKVKGFLKNGLRAWIYSGKEIQGLPHISVSDLQKRIKEANPPTLIDVRTSQEFSNANIEGSVNMPFDIILGEDADFGVLGTENVIICQSGFRSSIAASLLQARGFENISMLSGGMMAWKRF